MALQYTTFYKHTTETFSLEMVEEGQHFCLQSAAVCVAFEVTHCSSVHSTGAVIEPPQQCVCAGSSKKESFDCGVVCSAEAHWHAPRRMEEVQKLNLGGLLPAPARENRKPPPAPASSSSPNKLKPSSPPPAELCALVPKQNSESTGLPVRGLVI